MKTKLALLVLLTTLVVASESRARVLVATNSTWRYFKGTSEASSPTNAWRELNFDDSAWLTGAAPFHYGTNAVGGDDSLTGGTVLTDMRSNYTCVFLRQKFVIDDTNSLRGLRLNVWIDDGLGIWINGQQARVPISLGGLAYTNQATASREATRTPLSLDSVFSLLRDGTNVLCLQGYNVALADDDFRVEAELTEAPPTLSLASATLNVLESTTQAVVRVIRTGAFDGGITVDYSTTNGTAVAGQDYVATNGTLVFAEGQAEQSIVVPILNDESREPAESFQIRLSNAGGGAALGSPTVTTVQIADNDPGFQVEFANYYVQENAGPVVLAVLLGADGDFAATVDFTTTNGTALAGSDYVATNGTLTFAAGEQLKLVPVAVLNDGVREGRETFTFSLQNATSAVGLGLRTNAITTIFESDPGVRFARTVQAVHEFEGELRLTVLRGNDADLGPFTVNFVTSNLTAIAGVDYIATNGTLAFAEGEMTRSFTVRILDDEVPEPDRSFQVVLGPVTGAAVLGNPTNITANVTVRDDTGRKPHGFGSLVVSNDGTLRLTLEGRVSPRFTNLFDLYPVEVSSNLVNWAPLCTLLRTNSSTNALVCVDAEARHFGARFYRLAATNYVTPYLLPTGPYPVGRVDRMVTDSSRRNRYAVSTNGSFMVSIFYPTVAEAGHSLLHYDNEVRGRDPNYWGTDIDRVPWFFTAATANLRLATNEARYPIVFQSHGVTGAAIDLQNQCENLASHGYVVVAPDHYDTWAVLYPDGTYLLGSEAREGLTVAGLRDRVADLVFLMNQLEQWNQTDSLFAGRLNLDAVAGTGFSWGGPTVGEFCRSDSRCKAAISLDGGSWGNAPDLSALGLQKPSLMMNSSGNADETLFSKTPTDAFWFQISGAAHVDFVDLSWWEAPSGIYAGLEVSRTIHAYQVSFLNKYLKGQDDHLMDGPPGALFPRVSNFKKK